MPKKNSKKTTKVKDEFAYLEIGDSGTKIYDGIINEEYNADLRGTKGISVYDEMRKSDATVRAIMMICTLPIRSTKWYVEPASEDKADVEIAQFVEDNLMDKMTITWDDFLRQALLELAFGVMVFEKVYQENDGKIELRKLSPRIPRSIIAWQTSKKEDGITWSKANGTQVDIPIEKLLIFVNEKEGDNWWGTSFLRAAYKHWYFKNNFYKIDAISFERQGIGIPYVKLPDGANDEDKAIAESLAKNLRGHERAYVVMDKEYEVGFLEMKGNSVRDPAKSIAHHNREITKSVLAQFLELGSTEVGSKALSEDHSNIFYNSLKAVAMQIADNMNRYCIPDLVDFNYNVKEYPKLRFGEIGPVNYTLIIDSIDKLSKGGFLTKDEGMEKYIRSLLNLPELEDVNIDKKPEEKKTASEKMEFMEEYKAYRPLTFAEKKVHFNTINDHFDQFKDEFINTTGPILADAREKFLKELEQAINDRDIAKLKDIEVKYQGPYKDKVKEIIRKTYDFAKSNASIEMGVKNIPTPKIDKERIEMQADMITRTNTEKMVTEGKKTVISQLQKSETPYSEMTDSQKREIMIAVDRATFDLIEKLTQDTSDIVIGGGINQGRRAIQTNYSDKVYALQRSEILDGRICDYCLSMDGRIFPKNHPFTKNDIFHSNCRGIWVEILTDEQEKPEITLAPQSLLDKFGGQVNDLTQPNKPIVRKNSPAGQFAKDNGKI